MATSQQFHQLAPLIRQEKETLLRDWRIQVRSLDIARALDVPTLNDHIPDLLEELARQLERSTSESMIDELSQNPVTHGLDRLQLGFDIEEVVAEYSALREVLHSLIEQNGWRLESSPNRTINRVIDKSIGLAVQTYATQKALEVRQRRQEYLSFVAHDLRTPLSAMGMASALLEDGFSSKDGEAPYLFGVIRRNLARLSQMVVKVVQEESYLDGLDEPLERHHLPLRSLVQECYDDLKPLAVFQNSVLVNEVADDVFAYANAVYLAQVFQNLISNAIGYTPGGRITTGARRLSKAVEVWVSDTGQGIPGDRLAHVFDKLETDPDPTRGGMGLGLAIVKNFVRAHGGEVSVESQVGTGTTFTFTLPNEP